MRIGVSKTEVRENARLETIITEKELLEKTYNDPESFLYALSETAETFVEIGLVEASLELYMKGFVLIGERYIQK